MSSTLGAVSQKTYLGREFVTWLWFLCEVEGGHFALPSGDIELVAEDNLVLVGHEDEDSATQVKGGCPTLRPEAASALAAGMTVRRVRMIAARDERQWTFTLDAETLDLKGVKVPAVDAEDPLEQLAERLESAEELRLAVDEMFASFLSIRLTNQWDEVEAPRMRDWIRLKVDRVSADQDRFNHDAPKANVVMTAPIINVLDNKPAAAVEDYEDTEDDADSADTNKSGESDESDESAESVLDDEDILDDE